MPIDVKWITATHILGRQIHWRQFTSTKHETQYPPSKKLSCLEIAASTARGPSGVEKSQQLPITLQLLYATCETYVIIVVVQLVFTSQASLVYTWKIIRGLTEMKVRTNVDMKICDMMLLRTCCWLQFISCCWLLECHIGEPTLLSNVQLKFFVSLQPDRFVCPPIWCNFTRIANCFCDQSKYEKYFTLLHLVMDHGQGRSYIFQSFCCFTSKIFEISVFCFLKV